MMVVVYVMVVVLKEEMEGGEEWFRAMTRMVVGVSKSWAALDPWAEPSAKLRRTHHLSLQVF